LVLDGLQVSVVLVVEDLVTTYDVADALSGSAVAALWIGSEQGLQRIPTLVERDASVMREATHRRLDHAVAVGHRKHSHPHDARGVTGAPDRAREDFAV